jgi:hypothetical protein
VDLISVRGLRNVIDGEAELLAGFEFIIRGKLGTSLFVLWGVIIRVANIAFDCLSSALHTLCSATTHFKTIFALVLR